MEFKDEPAVKLNETYKNFDFTDEQLQHKDYRPSKYLSELSQIVKKLIMSLDLSFSDSEAKKNVF